VINLEFGTVIEPEEKINYEVATASTDKLNLELG